MFNGFYADKRIFLTGDTGFKGAWLALWLIHMGAKVGTFSLAPHTTPSLHELAGISSIVQRLGGDIRQSAPLARAMQEFQPDIVIHMAAQSLVRPSYELPLETFETNVMGTANVLDAVRLAGSSVRGLINVTSDKCYDNKEWVWGYRENDPMGGHDPYSASKGCAELITNSYINSFFEEGDIAVASVRAGNVIGGGDFAKDRLIPDMVRAFSAGETVSIRSPHATRPWQHVLEPLHGYLMLAKNLFEKGHAFEGGWNFGPSDESTRSVGEVVTTFSEKWGDGAQHELDQGNHPHEANLLKLDCSKVKQYLGWQPKSNFSIALDWTISWYKGWSEGRNCAEMTLDQIKEFEEMP